MNHRTPGCGTAFKIQMIAYTATFLMMSAMAVAAFQENESLVGNISIVFAVLLIARLHHVIKKGYEYRQDLFTVSAHFYALIAFFIYVHLGVPEALCTAQFVTWFVFASPVFAEMKAQKRHAKLKRNPSVSHEEFRVDLVNPRRHYIFGTLNGCIFIGCLLALVYLQNDIWAGRAAAFSAYFGFVLLLPFSGLKRYPAGPYDEFIGFGAILMTPLAGLGLYNAPADVIGVCLYALGGLSFLFSLGALLEWVMAQNEKKKTGQSGNE